MLKRLFNRFRFALLGTAALALIAFPAVASASELSSTDRVDAHIEAVLAAIHAGESVNVAITKGYTFGDAEHAGYTRISDGSGNYVTIKQPALSADYNFPLPTSDGTNGQVLTTNGAGTASSWTSVSGFGVTTFADKTIPYASAADTFSFDSTNFTWDDTANAMVLKLGSGTTGGKLALIEPSGGGTSTATLISPALAADAVVTVPNATATLATIGLTETLVGKTLTSPVLNGWTGTGGTVSADLKTTGASANLGYATGAGGAVTQLTSKSTGVTMVPNPCSCGTITMHNASLTGDAEVTFTVTDSAVAAADTVLVSVKSGASTGKYFAFVSAVGVGTFDITVSNVGSTASEVVVINFVIIKSVAS